MSLAISPRAHLLVHSHGIQTIIHDVHPAILGSQDKQGHQSLKWKGTSATSTELAQPPLTCHQHIW